MASGRRDYTWGFLNEAASEGRYNQTFQEYVSKDIAAGAVELIWSYTVPAGYRLALNRIEVCSFSRIRNWVFLVSNGVTILTILFDTNYSFIVSDKNPLYTEAGQIVYVSCRNLDELSSMFYGQVTGVLEQL